MTTNPTLHTLAAAIDEMAQQRVEDRARARASAMERRRLLLAEVASIEQEHSITPTTAELRKRERDDRR